MADHDLAPSLSEEESELMLSSRASSKKKLASVSPTRQKEQQGFKFNAEQQKLTSPNFDFASQSKNGQVTNNSNSSSETEDTEGFVLVNPGNSEGEINGSGGGGGVPPTTPSKLPTPHKRTAELVEEGSTGITGANGSPPSSPAPKKRKAWEDFLQEDNAKRAKEKGQAVTTDGQGRINQFLTRKVLLLTTVILLISVVIAVCLSPRFRDQEQEVIPTQKTNYSWKKAHAMFFNSVQKMKSNFPKQNSETWIQLIASIGSTLEETESDHPAAVTVLLPPFMSDQFAKCFAQKVGNIVNTAVAPILQNRNDSKSAKPFPPEELNPTTFEKSSITNIRIDLGNYFRSKGKAVIAFDIDKLKKEEYLLLFHGLCDNFKAVDKRATILFPLRVPPSIYEKYEWIHARGGDISTDVLNDMFKKVVSADTGPALVARITDGVILLNGGDKC